MKFIYKGFPLKKFIELSFEPVNYMQDMYRIIDGDFSFSKLNYNPILMKSWNWF